MMARVDCGKVGEHIVSTRSVTDRIQAATDRHIDSIEIGSLLLITLEMISKLLKATVKMSNTGNSFCSKSFRLPGRRQSMLSEIPISFSDPDLSMAGVTVLFVLVASMVISRYSVRSYKSK